MSIEHAKAAIEKIKNDKAFLDKINAKNSPEEKIAVCREDGFEFTLEDLKQLVKEAGGESSGINPFCCGNESYALCPCDGSWA